MGSSETGGVVDCSVGSIVWVRRRNGSWWPGKILRPEELTSSHLTSPRSGTPVKLLGREDASVDWYNLEKSKRVKSFRCGEFDNCIERAEAAQGVPPKKREKYARREDAIMHALELERQIIEKKYGKVGNSSNSRSRRTSPDAVTSSVKLGNGSGNRNDCISDHLPQRVGSSISEKSARGQSSYEETIREGNQLSGDDDCPDVLPRMTGLQDIAHRTASPAREELSGVAFRPKRTRNAYLPYDSDDYLIDGQTLSSQLEIPVSKISEISDYPADVGENQISGSTEDTETDNSETDSLESDSDDEMTALSDGSASIELRPKYHRRIEAQEEHASISSSEDFDDLMLTESGVSKRPQNRKRNDSKRYMDRSDVEAAASAGYTNIKSGFDKTHRNHMSRYRSDFEGLSLNSRRDYSLGGSHFGSGGPMLMEVDLKVQANNYRRDVPMISLMSKLNGNAIVGHPISIEAIESGLTETRVIAADYFSHEIRDGQTPLTSVWRTGRRTANSRVPRPFSPKGFGRKTRALSSIQVERYHSGSSSGGLMKEGDAPTAVACIPVNLVFSRLHEELVHQ